MPELLPAFDGAIFAAAHVLGCTTGQAAVLGATAGRGGAIFMFRFHFELVSDYITVGFARSKPIPPVRARIKLFIL